MACGPGASAGSGVTAVLERTSWSSGVGPLRAAVWAVAHVWPHGLSGRHVRRLRDEGDPAGCSDNPPKSITECELAAEAGGKSAPR